jgi:hypothetical protein
VATVDAIAPAPAFGQERKAAMQIQRSTHSGPRASRIRLIFWDGRNGLCYFCEASGTR